MSIQSPSGSTFPYYYKGGELHALKYGGLGTDLPRLAALMDAEEHFLRSRPAQRLRVWVDFYETDLTAEAAGLFAEHIKRLEGQLVRLAPVGCGRAGQRRIRSALRSAGGFAVPVRFFNDPEEAKTWLVSAEQG